MALELSPEIEAAVRERAAAEGLTVNDLLARLFAPRLPDAFLSDARPDASVAVQTLLALWQAQEDAPLALPSPARNGGMTTPTRNGGAPPALPQQETEDGSPTETERDAEDRLWATLSRLAFSDDWTKVAP